MRRSCNKCGKYYDEAFNECPICREPNEQQPRRFKNLTVLNIFKQIGLFLMGYVGFQLIGAIIQYAMIFANGLTTPESIIEFFELSKNQMIVNTVGYVIVAIGLFGIINVDIKKFFKSFKSWKPYVAAIVGVAAILAFSFIYGIFLQLIGAPQSVNGNEDTLNKITKDFPFTSIVIFAIIGPICEELTYRVGLFSLSKRAGWWLAYPLTIIIFTFIHFDFAVINLDVLFGINKDPEAMVKMVEALVIELVNIPYYISGAFVLSFLYDKFGFASSATCHILNNIISLVLVAVVRGVI